MSRLLVVEDDPAILRGLSDNLRLESYEVATAVDGESGLQMARDGGFDLVILDVMLPKLGGFDVCRRLRESGVSVPILMLTARGEEADRVHGLDLGAGRLGRVFTVGAVVDHHLEALGRGGGEVVGPDLGGDGELIGDASKVSHVSYRRLGGGPFV